MEAGTDRSQWPQKMLLRLRFALGEASERMPAITQLQVARCKNRKTGNGGLHALLYGDRLSPFPYMSVSRPFSPK